MLKVWGRRSSFNVQKVMWLIGELGLAHRHIDAGGGFGGLDAARIPGDESAWPRAGDQRRCRNGVGIPRHPALSGRAISTRIAAAGGSGLTIRQRGRGSTAGWTGRKPRCSRISSTECSGDFIERRRTSETGRRSAQHWRAAPGISRNWIGCWKIVHFCSVTRCRSPISPRAHRCTAISSWRSSGRTLPQVERWYRALQQRAAFAEHVMIPFDELRGLRLG